MSQPFDRRRHPVRPDLAAADYEGLCDTARFVEGEVFQVSADRLAIRPDPRSDRSIDTEALKGEWLTVYEQTPEGWAWGQLATDGYVGWFSSDGIGPVNPATHRVRALCGTYPLSGSGSQVPAARAFIHRVAGHGDFRSRNPRPQTYAILNDGSAVVAKHLVPLDEAEADWVAVAEEFLGTPYLWGGRSSLGLDCSALVQLAAQAGGYRAPARQRHAGTGSR